MGVAASNRGSTLIRDQLTRAQRPHAFVFMDALNALERYPDAGLPWAPLRLFFDTTHQVWWLQDAGKGDAGFGYWYRSLYELCKRWQITLTAYDATTGIYQAVPAARPECQTLEAFLSRCNASPNRAACAPRRHHD